MNFRKDINALRFIAVFAVMIFHFRPSWLPGGFIGVDVFFVISGFLMTGIIHRDLQKSKFSLIDFYIKRAKRILPPLSVLCISLLIFGYFFLPPTDYGELVKHANSSIALFSNHTFFSEIGYFNSSSIEKWFLHTWSLSVEWQFYLFYPILLLIISSLTSVNKLKYVILAITVIALTFSIFSVQYWSNASFYLLPARIWEFLIGALAYYFPLSLKKRNRVHLKNMGLTLLAFSFFLIKEPVLWPGLYTLLPVIGTLLIILAESKSILDRNFIIQKIGSSSYSIYLWHWPVVVFFHLCDFKNLIALFAGLSLSFILGLLSYYFIEKKWPFDYEKTYSKNLTHSLYFFVPISLFLITSFISLNSIHNFNSNLFEDLRHKLSLPKICHVNDQNLKEARVKINCKIGNKNDRPKGIILGDSFAGNLDPFFQNILAKKSTFISRSLSYCFPSINYKEMLGPLHIAPYCSQIRKVSTDEIVKDFFDVIILSARWDLYFYNKKNKELSSILELIKVAAKHSKLVLIFERPISYKNAASATFLRGKSNKLFSDRLIRHDLKASLANNLLKKELATLKLKNAHLITRDQLYKVNDKISDFTNKGLPFIYDQGHLNNHGAIQASESFKETYAYNQLKLILNL